MTEPHPLAGTLYAAADALDAAKAAPAEAAAIVRARDDLGRALKAVRQALGMSSASLARFLMVSSERNVRRWEAGTHDVPGPVVRALELVLAGAPIDLASYRSGPGRPRKAGP